MNHPAENWKCKCGRPPSLEHGVGEYCAGRIIIEGLESERDALRKEVESLKNEHTYRDETFRSMYESLKSKDAEIERLRELLKNCVGWMEPVMEGFCIPKDSGAVKGVLEPAKAALEAGK